jgi:hypothetical protein
VWKLAQATDFKRVEGFPFFSVGSKHGYADTETSRYDSDATKYMTYLLGPCLVIYTIYNGVYNSHKSVYKFILSTLVSGIYVAGFIKMTP